MCSKYNNYFYDISNFITIPISVLTDSTHTLTTTIGVGVPASAISHLNKIGLFNHTVAEKLSKIILEPHGPTLTSHWMDAVKEYSHLYPKGVQLGYHRVMHGHHFVTDFFRTLSNKNLSCIDFCKHLGTDIVTKNGLPLLPSSTIKSLSDILGISVSKIAPWVSFNILDCMSSIVAIGHAGSNVVDIVTGTAQWSSGYCINTFGVGALELISGCYTSNPVLIGAGATDIVCGTITACTYYSQPFFCGVPVNELLQSSCIGSAISLILTGTELVINRKKYTPSSAIKEISKRVAISGLLSSLSIISTPLAITAAAGFTGYKIIKNMSNNEEYYLKSIDSTSEFAKNLNQYFLKINNINCENISSINTIRNKMLDK